MKQVLTLMVHGGCSSCGRQTDQRWLILTKGDAAAVECDVCRQLFVVEQGVVSFPPELSGRRVSGGTLTAVAAALGNAEQDPGREESMMTDRVLDLALLDQRASEARLTELRQQIALEERRLTELTTFVDTFRSYQSRLPGAEKADGPLPVTPWT